MKIRIKNNKNNNLLVEGAPLNAQTPANVASATVDKPDDFSLMQILSVKQFIQERKKELLPVDIAIPRSFYDPIMLKPGPQDLAVVMHTVQTNKARKTRDLDAWGMVDPISTFNNAEDCCYKIFNSFFNGPVQLAQSKAEMKANKQDMLKDSNEGLVYETLEYDYYKPLNEGAGLAGYALGSTVGSAANNSLIYLGAAGAGFALNVAPAVGAIMVSTDLIGKAGQKIFGDTNRNDRNTNDSVSAHLNGKKIAQATTQNALTQNDNIVESIDKYIREILQAGRELLTGISTNMGKKYTEEFENFIIASQSELAEKFKEFIKENSKQIQQQKELRDKIQLNKLTTQKNNAESRLQIINKLNAYMINGGNDAATASQIIDDITNNNKRGKSIVDNWDNNEDSIDNIITKYKSNKKGSQQNKNNENILNTFNNTTQLNEDNTNQNNERITINLEKIYKELLPDLTQRIGNVLDEFDPKNMVNLTETKQIMEDLIKSADEEIKNKIQIITKANTSPTAAQQAGLGTAALQFLAGHPIEANNLTGVWSRHLADLKMRMNNRIRIMTDYNNPVRILGWTFNMCRTVLPEFFARMLLYRYAYAILTNNGIYSYNTAQAEEDIRSFTSPIDASSGYTIQDAYISSARAQLINIFNNYGNEYTNGDTFIDVDENGGYKLNSNTIRYGSLMLHRIAGVNLTTDDKLVGGMTLANLSNDDKGLEHLIDILYGNMVLNGLITNGFSQFENMVHTFRLSQELTQSKELIKNTYNKIFNDIQYYKVQNIESNERAKQIADSLYIINTVGPREIYRVYKSNENKLTSLMEAFKNANYGIVNEGEDKNKDKEVLTNIKNDVNKYFANITFPNLPENAENSYAEGIKAIFSTDENKAKNDYYAYILSWYNKKEALAGTTLSTNLFNPDEIKNVCEMTPPLLKLAVSGLLAYAMEEDKKDEKENKDLEDLKDKLIHHKNDFLVLKRAEEEISKLSKDENKSDEDVKKYDELKKDYDEIRTTVKKQIASAYLNSANEKYRINALNNFNDDNVEQSLYEGDEFILNEGKPRHPKNVRHLYGKEKHNENEIKNINKRLVQIEAKNNSSSNYSTQTSAEKPEQQDDKKDWYSQILNNFGLYKDTADKNQLFDNIKTAMAPVKIQIKDGESVSDKPFNEIGEDSIKNQILIDLVNAIVKGITDGNVEEAINELGKKLDLDISSDPTNKLTNSLNTIKEVNDTLNDTYKALQELDERTKDNESKQELISKVKNSLKLLLNNVLQEMLDYYHGLKLNPSFTDDFISNEANINKICELLKSFKELNKDTLISFKEKLEDVKVKTDAGENDFNKLNSKQQNDLLNRYADLFIYAKNNIKAYDSLVRCMSLINTQNNITPK